MRGRVGCRDALNKNPPPGCGPEEASRLPVLLIVRLVALWYLGATRSGMGGFCCRQRPGVPASRVAFFVFVISLLGFIRHWWLKSFLLKDG
jgi:hypothetical protein